MTLLPTYQSHADSLALRSPSQHHIRILVLKDCLSQRLVRCFDGIGLFLVYCQVRDESVYVWLAKSAYYLCHTRMMPSQSPLISLRAAENSQRQLLIEMESHHVGLGRRGYLVLCHAGFVGCWMCLMVRSR